MDRRLTPANGRAALESVRGMVDAERFVPGESALMTAPLTDLCREPGGARERQVLMGDAVTVVDRHDGWAFVQTAKDGFCGYVPESTVGPHEEATHWVAAPATHLYPEPALKVRERAALTMNARLRVIGESGKWLETSRGWVPGIHLKPLGEWHKDPVAVAQTFLGVPYLWGGNSRSGLDCSGLVQAALMACGKACPGDSDLQLALGVSVGEKQALKRGDLIFWKGHVAMAMNADHMIHATAAFMAVVVEQTRSAIKRINEAGDGPVIARRRPQ
jgi:cell wall-associated NlpC family hydrolase